MMDHEWQYLCATATVDDWVIEVKGSRLEKPISIHEWLNVTGQHGWELVFYTPHKGDHLTKLILKRPGPPINHA